jgi:hypothetical protein
MLCSFACLDDGLGVGFAGLAVHSSLKEDLITKWPNRGDSGLFGRHRWPRQCAPLR